MKSATPTSLLPDATEDKFRRASSGLMVLLVALFLCLPGCFDGGSIPPAIAPGLSRVYGRVMTAELPLRPFTRAMVTLRVPSTNGEIITLTQFTNDSGQFDISKVPTGRYSTTVQIIAHSEDNNLSSPQMTFRLFNGHAANLIITMPSADFDVLQGKEVVLNPPTSTIAPHETVHFSAQVRDAAGKVLSVQPSLLFNDDFGSINQDGTFSSSSIGTGTVFAFWYNTEPKTANIIVTTPGTIPPPPPPTGSGSGDLPTQGNNGK